MIVIEDAQNDPLTVPVHEMFEATRYLNRDFSSVGNQRMRCLVPSVYDILDERSMQEANLQLAQTIVYQAATAVRNACLFEQTQAALAETETLYAYTS